MSTPRRHHLLPEFYLAGFTDTGTKDGFVHVFDYFNRKRYRAKPRQIANERDFYRINEPNEDPYRMERELAELEGEVAPVLRRVLETGIFHGGTELGTILSFVALLYVRGRKVRERLSMSIEQTMLRKLKNDEVTREQWDTSVASQIRAGINPETLPTFEEAQQLAKEGQWVPKALEVLKVGLIPEMQQMIFDILVNHTWSLGRATPSSGGFICSDTPLSWGSLNPWEPNASNDSLDNPNTTVSIPLSKELALITRPNGRRGSYEAVDVVVAWVNARTHLFSKGTLYSPSENFILLREGNRIGHSSDYFSYVENAWRTGIENP
jgi:hypothetical protein